VVSARRTEPIAAWSREVADAATAESGPGARDVMDGSVKPNPKSNALLQKHGRIKHSRKGKEQEDKKSESKR